MSATASKRATDGAAKGGGTFYTALRILGIVVLVLMLVTILYSGWISIENFGQIRV